MSKPESKKIIYLKLVKSEKINENKRKKFLSLMIRLILELWLGIF